MLHAGRNNRLPVREGVVSQTDEDLDPIPGKQRLGVFGIHRKRDRFGLVIREHGNQLLERRSRDEELLATSGWQIQVGLQFLHRQAEAIGGDQGQLVAALGGQLDASQSRAGLVIAGRENHLFQGRFQAGRGDGQDLVSAVGHGRELARVQRRDLGLDALGRYEDFEVLNRQLDRFSFNRGDHLGQGLGQNGRLEIGVGAR